MTECCVAALLASQRLRPCSARYKGQTQFTIQNHLVKYFFEKINKCVLALRVAGMYNNRERKENTMDIVLWIITSVVVLVGTVVAHVGWRACDAHEHRKDDQDKGTGLY